jgi:hypothetical protein
MCSSAVIDGYIYVAGGSIGYDSRYYLSSVECFDPRTEQWSYVAAMNSRRDGVCNYLYLSFNRFIFHFDDVIAV